MRPAPELRVEETPAEIHIQVYKTPVWWETCLGSAGLGSFTYIIAHATLHRSAFAATCMALIAVAASAVFTHRPVRITTTITKFEARIVGRFGGGYNPLRHIPLADTTGMEYRQVSGGDDAYQPEGLYLETRWYSACIAPFISEQQADELRNLAHRRFPHIAQAPYAAGFSLFQDDLVQLHLSDPTHPRSSVSDAKEL